MLTRVGYPVFFDVYLSNSKKDCTFAQKSIQQCVGVKFGLVYFFFFL